MSSASRTMTSCGTTMSCSYLQLPGQLLPTGVKSNCRFYHLRRILLFLSRILPSCLRIGAMPPSVGILRSRSAGLKPSCYQLRRSWLVMQLGLHRWSICLRDRYQDRQSTQSHCCHRMTLVTSYHRFVILNSLTGADFLQLEHAALTRTVRLKVSLETTYDDPAQMVPL